MTDEEKSKGWWQTLPGMITAVTATITALTGLVVAIEQAGWLTPRPRLAVTTDADPGRAPSGPGSAPSAEAPRPSTTPSPPTERVSAVELPALRDYKLGDATFTVLKAAISPRNAETDELRMRIRMLNQKRYTANFWDSSFRLILDGVPMAPVSNLNELVPGDSAKEGDVVFVITRGTAGAKLQITYGDDRTEIPFSLTAAR